MFRLTRLRIDRFRNVLPGTTLRFGPTFNVLLGKNATGKTTLLDLIAAVTNDDLSGYAKEEDGFDLTWWLQVAEFELLVRSERKPTQVDSLSDELRTEKGFADFLTIVLSTRGKEIGRIETEGSRGQWRAPDSPSKPFPVQPSGSTFGAAARALNGVWASYREEATRAHIPLIHKTLPMAGGLPRFDEATRVFEAFMRSPFEVRRRNKSRGESVSFSEFALPLELIPNLLRGTPEPLVIPFKKVELIADIPKYLGFAAAELYPRLLQRSREGETVTTVYQGFDCLFRRADGSVVSHELLSFGQKRLFAFFWYLAVRGEFPVIADELLNGLHYEWVELCLEKLHERQSFLATQHPFLLDHIPIESAEAVQTTFLRCSIEPNEQGAVGLSWCNFKEEEAERFYIAHQTGIQQVSEVLRSEGLW